MIRVEHNLDMVKRADWLINLGPDGGKHGGEIAFEGAPEELTNRQGALTAQHLRQNLAVARG